MKWRDIRGGIFKDFGHGQGKLTKKKKRKNKEKKRIGKTSNEGQQRLLLFFFFFIEGIAINSFPTLTTWKWKPSF